MVDTALSIAISPVQPDPSGGSYAVQHSTSGSRSQLAFIGYNEYG